MSKDLYVVPFIVVGKRLTVSIEARVRGGNSHFNREIFSFDSGQAPEKSGASWIEQELPEILNEAQKALCQFLSEQEAHNGVSLSPLQKRFVQSRSKALDWLVDCGFGERYASVTDILAELVRLGAEL